MRKKIDLKALEGRTIETVLTTGTDNVGIVFTDGSSVTLELTQTEWAYDGCSTCGWNSTPDVWEIEAYE